MSDDTASPEQSGVEGETLDASSGSYAVIRQRLEAAARALSQGATSLNDARKSKFGGQELTIVGSERLRTEHNCVPRNIVNVRGRLILGYNVQFALKKQVVPSDVFSVHRFEPAEGGFDLGLVDDDVGLTTDASFETQFGELYQYYKQARLKLLRHAGGKLLAVFQIGERADDIRAFRWAATPGQPLAYIDNRGERDHVYPPSHDFDWVQTTRDDHVLGRHPHVSIRDQVFVETVGGDLTIKVEDNTDDGAGVYSEPVDDPHQSLDDAEIAYAQVGTLLLLKMRPFGESHTRYFVFNTRTQEVQRIDAIGDACLQLPEDHGIIFPGGYTLRTGATKLFDNLPSGQRFKRMIRSPNGEDVLYIFHEEEHGRYVVLPYNLIRQEVQTPIQGHGVCLFDDGRMVILRADSDEPTRVHPVQIWQTPFLSDEFAAAAPSDGSFLGRLGNAELVRAVSDLFALERMVTDVAPAREIFEDLVGACTRVLDTYPWLARPEAGGLSDRVSSVRANAELIIDEFEKMQALRARAAEEVAQAAESWRRLELDLRPDSWRTIQEFLGALTQLRDQRGHLISLREIRLIDQDALQALEDKVIAATDDLSTATVTFLLDGDALGPLTARLSELDTLAGQIERTPEIAPLLEELAELSRGIEVLIEVAGSLDVGDPEDRTTILERIGEASGQLNRVRAVVEARNKTLRAGEARAEFAAQFKLLGQAVQSAVAMAETPEKCDEQLSRVLVQLEEVEGRFGEFDEFLGDLTSRREEILTAFESKRQSLVDARQRRVEALFTSAVRILESIDRRARTFKDDDKLNSYFASDSMVLKLRKLSEELDSLGDSVKAGELESRLKASKQQARRALRDQQDLFEEGDLIRLGKHRFSVNTQTLELTLVPRGDTMALHLTGTEFYEPVTNAEFLQTRPYWSQTLLSETDEVYRGEYLAAELLAAAEAGQNGLSIGVLTEAATQDGGLLALVQKAASTRYEEGYARGIHDHDAALILDKVLHLRRAAGLLRHASTPRAVAALFWASWSDRDQRARLQRRARNLARLLRLVPDSPVRRSLAVEISGHLGAFVQEHLPSRAARLGQPALLHAAALYLIDELAVERPRFVLGAHALHLTDALQSWLEATGERAGFDADLRAAEGHLEEGLDLATSWLQAAIDTQDDDKLQAGRHALLEAAVSLLTARSLDRTPAHIETDATLEGLLGQHPRIRDRTLHLRLDAFLDRLTRFRTERVPGYRAYRQARHDLLEAETRRLRIGEFKPRVMTSFVRNRLIDEVYLPIIGDNLAKQMGAAGANRRTDTMGLLLLISPPGYGKTTLMEYVASQLGVVFMKVNGPSLGHDVTSLDPAEAPSATARQEVEKINLAFEMGNNVMLYLDDIQHTHPELLQKFISLCDGTRRIEGVWNGRTQTYDLRGKKFSVVMAGNPYTESGDKFQVPDMLANRADTYNLGDILGGRKDLFALSYVQNCVTSSAVLAPVAARSPDDLLRFVRVAEGNEVDDADWSHDWSAGDRSEVVSVLQKLFRCRDTLLAVNAEYIASAATDERARTEPRFQLQGSYRNMAKLAEKVVPAMNDDELEQLIVDHYTGEAQTLTSGAEANLLKLAELRGTQTAAQQARWAAIKEGFGRAQLLGGASDDDPVARVTATLMGLQNELKGITSSLSAASPLEDELYALGTELRELKGVIAGAPPLDAALDSLGAKLESALEKGVSARQPAPSPAPSPAPAPAPQPSAAPDRSWFTPHLELSAEADLVLRHAVLLEVQRALVTHGRMQQHSHKQLEAGQLILSGTLPVMQHLAERVGALADTYVPVADRPAFLDAIRRSVATAIRDLATATDNKVQANDLALSLEEPTAGFTPAQPAPTPDPTELP